MTTREQRLRELVDEWRQPLPPVKYGIRTPYEVGVKAGEKDCALKLAAILNEPVEVSEEMVERYVNAVNAYLGTFTEKGWNNKRKNHHEALRDAARIGLAAALNIKEPGQ